MDARIGQYTKHGGYTTHRDCSAVRAPVIALAEAIRNARITDDGTLTGFENVVETYAEPEDFAVYPSAAVLMEGEAQYGNENSIGGAQYVDEIVASNGDKFGVFIASEATVPILVHCWAQEKEQRDRLLGLLEDISTPNGFNSGLVLDMPHYYNARTSIVLVSIVFEDNEQNSQTRTWKMNVRYKAFVPVIQLAKLAPMSAKAVVSVR